MAEPTRVSPSTLNGFPVDQLHTLPYRAALSVLIKAALTLTAGIPRLMRTAEALGLTRDVAVLDGLQESAEKIEDNLRALGVSQDGIASASVPQPFLLETQAASRGPVTDEQAEAARKYLGHICATSGHLSMVHERRCVTCLVPLPAAEVRHG